ncbi:hypothetical protein AOLI_G00020840 [Acnodon oligacanthus]
MEEAYEVTQENLLRQVKEIIIRKSGVLCCRKVIVFMTCTEDFTSKKITRKLRTYISFESSSISTTMASQFGITEAEMNEMSSVLQSHKATDVLAQVEGMLEQMTSVTLNIAVTGESGAGKSSFINAFRGVADDGPEAAETGVTVTTQVALAYPHPTARSVLLWDLPGIGTTSFQPGTYLEDVGLLKYDFFIIVTADRFQEYHYALAKYIMQAKKKFYFIRNKVDRDLEANAMRRSQKGLSDADVLDQLRANCEKNLTMCQVGKPQVFLLSSFDPQSYDFPVLQMTLLEELQGHKQHALLLSLPNLSASLIQNKKKALAGAVWKRAMVACLSSVGVGNSLCSIIPKVMDTLKSYQQAFCLDADSLHRLASITGISFEELQREVTSTFGKQLSANALESALSHAVPVQQVLATQLEKRVPVLGTVIAGGVSFAACYFLLTSALKNLSEDGERPCSSCSVEMAEFSEEDYDIITVNEIKETLTHEDLPSAVSKIKDYFEQQDRVELNIAVTGESGSGKSTFINAFRGMGDEEEGSAETGVVETTKVHKSYPHPKYPNVKLWDLPGIGTPNFKADQYLKQVEFQRYDFFIIIASDRFRECHATLAAEIVKMDKKFYFIRSKIDSNISAEKRKKKKIFNEQNILDAIRKDCIEGLETIGVDAPVVFLISCFDLALYDFNYLEMTMETELPQHKRHMLMLALPNITLEINERKKKALQKNIWKLALASAGVAAVPIPIANAAFSVVVDAVILVVELKKYYNAFSVDPASLQRLADRSGKSVDELKAVMKSPLHAEINKDLVVKLLTGCTVGALEAAAEFWLGLIPVVGSLVAGPLSFATVYLTLQSCLNGLAKDANNVLMAALETPV